MNTDPSEPVRAHVWTFSLKQLFLFLGAACPLLAPAHYFGGIYLFSVACSLVLIISCMSAYRTSATSAVFVAFIGLVIGFFLAFGVFTFGVHAFLNLSVCLILALAGARPSRFATALAITMFVAYGLTLYRGIIEARHLAQIKANTPSYRSLTAWRSNTRRRPPPQHLRNRFR